MKLLKILVLMVFVLALGLFSWGLMVPEVEWTVSVQVDSPPETVFALYMDHERLHEWLEGLKSIEIVEGEIGTVGSTYRLTFVEVGDEIVMNEEVTAIVPNKRFTLQTTHESMDMEAETLFVPSDGGTTITAHTKVRGNGVMMRSIMPMMQSHIQDRQQSDLERLKALIEADA